MDATEHLTHAMPDRECPICRSMMQFESSAHGRKSQYRCKRCGYAMKPRSMVFYMSIFVLALLTVSTIMFFVGAAFTPPPAPAYHVSTTSLG